MKNVILSAALTVIAVIAVACGNNNGGNNGGQPVQTGPMPSGPASSIGSRGLPATAPNDGGSGGPGSSAGY